MFAVSKILAPIVFSENCRGALRQAIALASRFGAELTLLHVLEPLMPFDFDSADVLEYIRQRRREWAVNELNKLAFSTFRRLSVKAETVEGDPAREISEIAARRHIDLVVMPTHALGPFRRFLLGSVTAKVLHDCACPVWTGAHLEQVLTLPSVDIRNVVCAAGFDAHTDVVLEWAAGMASAWDARLKFIHIVPCVHDAHPQEESIGAAQEQLENRRAALGIDAECFVFPGNVPAVVCCTARRMAADLLVIGRGHATGVAGRLPGTAYRIIRESACPVVTV